MPKRSTYTNQKKCGINPSVPFRGAQIKKQNFDPTKLPNARRISMHRYLTGQIQTRMTIKDIALHVGLKEEQVRGYLQYLKESKKLTKTSPFYKK